MAELAAVGVPAVLVPLPGGSPGPSGRETWATLTRAGAAVVLEDGDCTAERLAIELERLLSGPELTQSMRHAASELGRRDALSAVVSLIETQAGTGTRAGTARRVNSNKGPDDQRGGEGDQCRERGAGRPR